MRGAYTPLTEHEREILALLARGLTNAQIGWMLGMAGATVRNTLNQTIYPKLGFTGSTKRVRAARWWLLREERAA